MVDVGDNVGCTSRWVARWPRGRVDGIGDVNAFVCFNRGRERVCWCCDKRAWAVLCKILDENLLSSARTQ